LICAFSTSSRPIGLQSAMAARYARSTPWRVVWPGEVNDVHVFTTNVDGDGESAVPVGRPVDREGVQVTYFASRVLRRLYWSQAMGRALTAGIASFDIAHLHSVFFGDHGRLPGQLVRRMFPMFSPLGACLYPNLVRARAAWQERVDRADGAPHSHRSRRHTCDL